MRHRAPFGKPELIVTETRRALGAAGRSAGG